MADTHTPSDSDAPVHKIIQLGNAKRRVHAVEFEGKKYWLKRYGTERPPVARFGHKLLAFIMRKPIFRASPIYSPQKALEAEIAKLKAFENAGFPSIELIGVEGLVFVTKHAGKDLERTIAVNKSDTETNDEIMCQWAGLFGRIHMAGLCHGRPHLRDSIYNDGSWVLMDFEEHPEAVMPLATAQARDLVLLFMQLVKSINDIDKLDEAMKRYKENAPVAVLEEAAKVIRDIQPFISLLDLTVRIVPRKDTKRLSLATRFLQQNLETK